MDGMSGMDGMDGMDGMGGMGNGSDMGGMGGMDGMQHDCKMSMLWNWYTVDACFLSESWQTRSGGAFAGLCIGVVLLVILLEFFRYAGRQYDQYLVNQTQITVRAVEDQSKSSANAPTTSVTLRASIPQQAIRALLHTLHFATAYWIMLLAMYFNGYIIICIIIGAFIGSFIFQWDRLGLKLRRKKCDETRPVCIACGGLEINCHYSDTKPEWMDGGAREKQMADELKVMVKQKATERRERKWGQLPTITDLSPSAQAQQEQQQQQQQKEQEEERRQQQQQQQQPSDHIMSDAGDPTLSDAGSGEGTAPSTGRRLHPLKGKGKDKGQDKANLNLKPKPQHKPIHKSNPP
ncbi:hypothetical protein ONZ43_g5384 [Nemania bipapillata]|uniref:Uncharacterized protein n=1 Tax=Nemania bipapillata TaxID=110536 RepID=A0ACC2IBH8_9PEZI|nr:hypothetical protein ONZ43_g5384 [Nemania bipapillata]